MANVYSIFHKDESIFNMIANLTHWYSSLFLGPWNTLLALIRFTALLFWNKHSKIWSSVQFWLIIVLALLYPFLVNGYTFQNPFCFFNRQIEICHESQRAYIRFEMISNGIHVCLSASLGFATALARRFKLTEISADKRKFETHLLIQSFFSSILFGFYCVLGFFVDMVVDRKDEFNITDTVLLNSFQTIASCYSIYFHISSTLLLFGLS
uniref:Serpentine receptor class gamma n=1 Tax=Panagrolaimus davidi TaxID=227884 RepID=A0A914PZC7_9BILA